METAWDLTQELWGTRITPLLRSPGEMAARVVRGAAVTRHLESSMK